MEKPVAGKQAWVSEALRVLGEDGVEQVRVEALARRLGVTKGSFYWHFTDRADLLGEVLEAWQQRATADVISAVEANQADPAARLARLLAVTTAHRSAPGIESAVRAWGARDAQVRKRLSAVDARRERYVATLLRQCGFSAAVARRRAHLVYLLLIGEYAWVSHRGKPTDAATWAELQSLVLTGVSARQPD